MISPPPAAEPAALRLARSRDRLRQALYRLQATAGTTAQAGPASVLPAGWLDALRAEPATRVLLDALALWWARQPWQQSASLVAGLLGQRLRPVAARSPLGLVLGAAALGGLLVVLKPWRWMSGATLAAGLLPTLVSQLLAHLRPLSWIELLNSWLQAAAAPPPPP